MAEHAGLNKIRAIQQRWIGYQLAADVLLSAGVAILLGSILHYVFGVSFIAALTIFIALFGILSAMRRPWQITYRPILNFLNQRYPELEESSDLVLKPLAGLSLLEKLQLQKVEHALANVPDSPPQFGSRLRQAGILMLIALVLSIALAKLPVRWHSSFKAFANASTENAAKSLPPEKILPQIRTAEMTIYPPGYTGRSPRTQDRFSLEVEDGSSVNWAIKTNIDVKQVSLIFNEHETLKMQHGEDRSHWHISKIISAAGFYQVSIDGKLSDLYSLMVIKDAPPVIKIKAPKQYTHIDAGEKQLININVTVNDDYGVGGAMIGATVAKGSGEAVKFKEYNLNFDEMFGGHNRQYDLKKQIDLQKLNMEPGDELYFYMQAMDTRRQSTRTDVYIVSIQDTAALLSMDGIISGVTLKPEFFRSERQIIIDSQQLIHERDSLSKAEFDRRSNELGTDQKLLRLRYGKFLGEEDESQIGEEAGNELGKAENFSNSAMVMDAYTDKHDNAEDASFLEPTTKAQLKATLTEMWKAELQLRLYKPEDALQFEYKALRLLKDLQQKSRSYVAKTGYKTTPLKQEKRLTGDLSKISQPVTHEDVRKQDDQFDALKKAVVVLEQLKAAPNLNAFDNHTLQIASQQLSAKVGSQPKIYLPAVSAMRHILAGKVNTFYITLVEKAIQHTLPVAIVMPQSLPGTDIGLSQGYFKNLNRLNR